MSSPSTDGRLPLIQTPAIPVLSPLPNEPDDISRCIHIGLDFHSLGTLLKSKKLAYWA